MRVAELRAPDLANGFLEALKNLTSHVHLTPDDAKWILRAMRKANQKKAHEKFGWPAKPYYVFVAKDGKDIGAATTLFTHWHWFSDMVACELKFIHSKIEEGRMHYAKVAHLGDIPRLIKGLKQKAEPTRVMEEALHEAQTERCYKVIVDCQSVESILFFHHYGFRVNEVAMRYAHQNFHRRCWKDIMPIGHIEDVARIPDQRWKGSGKLVVQAAIDKANEIGCGELVLNCKDDAGLIGFYESLGFEKCGVEMRLDLKIGKDPLDNRKT